MPQMVPAFTFSETARAVRGFIYDFWAEKRRPPGLRDLRGALGLTRRQIVDAYRELQLGAMITADERTLNCNLLKAPPYSSFPSQVEAHIDGSFHSFAGCACEGLAFGRMPQFEGKDVRLESFCACCLEPITVVVNHDQILSCQPGPDVAVHISLSPWEWNTYDLVAMCDSINFVIDAEHAERFERQSCRRGVLFSLPQAVGFVSAVSVKRGWDYDWGPICIDPTALLAHFAELGVDVRSFEPDLV
jgi:hypothetical protein